MKRYLMTVVLMFDEFINAVLGGYANETISHRMAVDWQEGKLVGCIFCRIFEWIDPGHCSLQFADKIDQYTRGAITVADIRDQSPGYIIRDGSGQKTSLNLEK